MAAAMATGMQEEINTMAVCSTSWLTSPPRTSDNGSSKQRRQNPRIVATKSPDVPPMQTVILENPYPEGPYGAKGLGELPMDGPAPAVVAAVLHATGRLVSELPVSPDRLMRALDGQP